jgi:hypothetical protein
MKDTPRLLRYWQEQTARVTTLHFLDLNRTISTTRHAGLLPWSRTRAIERTLVSSTLSNKVSFFFCFKKKAFNLVITKNTNLIPNYTSAPTRWTAYPSPYGGGKAPSGIPNFIPYDPPSTKTDQVEEIRSKAIVLTPTKQGKYTKDFS